VLRSTQAARTKPLVLNHIEPRYKDSSRLTADWEVTVVNSDFTQNPRGQGSMSVIGGFANDCFDTPQLHGFH